MRKRLIFLLVFSLVLSGCGLTNLSESPTASTTLSPSPTTSSSIPTSSPTGLSVTWTKIEQGNFPPDRIDYCLSYDSKRDRLLFFGGLSIEAGKYLKDLWAFDFATNLWELLSEGKELPSPNLYPHPASPREIVCDPLGDRLLLFQCGPSKDTQLTNGNQPLLLGGDSPPISKYQIEVIAFSLEENCWAQLDPPLKPPDSIYWFNTIWDPKNDRVFLLGKYLWVFDCKDDRWRELADNITLPGTFHLDLGPSSYDPREDRLLLLKRRTDDDKFFDISACKLPRSSWVDLKSLTPPNFRELRYVAYDPRFHVMILPGGGNWGETGFHPEIWIYSLDGNFWSYCGDLPGNSREHLIVPGKPGEAYILTCEMTLDEPPHHLWHLTLGP
ncbi:MAG: kelch repeat-containing protein [Deltaproteobacteria bacterium]